MATNKYSIILQNHSRTDIGEISLFEDASFIWNFNDVGKWKVKLPIANNDEIMSLIKLTSGIVLAKNGEAILSGAVTDYDWDWKNKADLITLEGLDDLNLLNKRLAYPDPAGDFTSQEHDTKTDVCETVLKYYVDYNIGSNALVIRQLTGLIIENDNGRGSSVTGNARFDPLLEFLRGLALQGGDLGFRIVDYEFQVYEPEDKTSDIIFGREFGNISAIKYKSEVPDGNYGICGGDGEGIARTFKEKGDSQSIVTHGRYEFFMDRRDTSDTNTMITAIEEELLKRAERYSLEVKPLNLDGFAFIDDFNLGDKVTAVVRGEYIENVVRQVKLEMKKDDPERYTVVLGTPENNPRLLDIFGNTKKLGKKISELERRL